MSNPVDLSKSNLTALAEYIFEWLAERNGGELSDALDLMTVRDRRQALEELKMIILHGGQPPNWT